MQRLGDEAFPGLPCRMVHRLCDSFMLCCCHASLASSPLHGFAACECGGAYTIVVTRIGFHAVANLGIGGLVGSLGLTTSGHRLWDVELGTCQAVVNAPNPLSCLSVMISPPLLCLGDLAGCVHVVDGTLFDASLFVPDGDKAVRLRGSPVCHLPWWILI